MNPTTKVLMFTAMDDAAAASQAFFEAGASAFVSKGAAEDIAIALEICSTTEKQAPNERFLHRQ